jgi:hypothetical protein
MFADILKIRPWEIKRLTVREFLVLVDYLKRKREANERTP